MANNVTLPLTGTGSSASIFGTVEKASAVHVQRVSVEWYASTGALLSPAVIGSSSSGATTLVAGTTDGQTIRVMSLWFKVSGAVDLSFYDAATTSGTQLCPPMPFTSGSEAFVLPTQPEPWLVASSTFGVMLFKSAGVQVSGRLLYTKS